MGGGYIGPSDSRTQAPYRELVASLERVRVQTMAGAESLALYLLVSAFWGLVVYVAVRYALS